MGFLDLFRTKKSNKVEEQTDIHLAQQEKLSTPNKKAERIIREERYLRPRPLSYLAPKTISRSIAYGNYVPPVHDFAEIARAIDSEALLARSIQKHREFILKEGWSLHGTNPDTVEYAQSRLREFELVTGITTEEWLREIVTNLVSFSTAFLVYKRDQTKSTGIPIRLHGRTLDPIAGIFPMDPVSVSVRQNDSGRIIEWRQRIDGSPKEAKFLSHDVLALTIDRKSGFVFGTPYCVPVLDDIRMLRRLEELTEELTHKYLFPFYHYTVGTDEQPADMIETPDGELVDEVDIVRAQLEDMPSQGGLVTPHRHAIEILGAEGKVLDLEPYIKHAESRVMAGLRLSDIDVGRGDSSNRSTAVTITKNLVDAVKDYQQVITDQLTCKLLDILILEGGFDLTEENRVYFMFPSPDREEMRANQNHGMTLFQSNLITHTEFRQDYLNYDNYDDEDWKDTFFERFEKVKAIIAAIDEPYTVKPTSALASNKSMPENQHGVLATKPAVSKNDINTHVSSIFDIVKKANIQNGQGSIDELSLCSHIIDKSKHYFYEYIDTGCDTAKTQSGDRSLFIVNKDYKFFVDTVVSSDLQKIFKKAIILFSNKKSTMSYLDMVNSIEHEIKIGVKRLLKVAYRFGYCKAALQLGSNSVRISGRDIALNRKYIKYLYIDIDEDITMNDIEQPAGD